jgi:hypothetical protein
MKENHIYQKILTLLEMQLDALKIFFGTDYTKLDFTLTSKEHIGFIINSMGQSYRIPLGDIQINPDIWVGLDTNTPGYAGNLLDSSIKIHTNRGISPPRGTSGIYLCIYLRVYVYAYIIH